MWPGRAGPRQRSVVARRGVPLRAALQLALGLIVSTACLYFAMRGTDWLRVRNVLAAADPAWIAVALIAGVMSLVVRAERWVQLLRPVIRLGLTTAVSLTAIGAAAGAVLPLRLGELVRPALLGRHTGVGLSPALSSIVLERLFDVVFVIVSFLAFSLVYPVPGGLRAGAIALAGGSLGAMALLVLAERWRSTTDRWLERALGWLPTRVGAWVRPVAAGVLDGFRGVADPRTVLVVSALSAAVWALVALVFLCSILALHIDVPLIPAALASVVIVAAFVFLPQAPGFVGTWQAGCVVALGLFGVPSEKAVGYSMLTWVVSMTFNVAAGGIFLVREGVSLRDLLSSASQRDRTDSL